MNRFFLFVLVISIFCSTCSKAPEYPNEPFIMYQSMTKNRMLQSLGNKYRDSLSFSISFTDGDGDIGTPESQGKRPNDAFIIDEITGDTAEFYTLPYIAPKGASKGINGEMKFIVFTNCCDVPDAIKCQEKSVLYPLDTLHYKLIIKDRGGNKSNELRLPPIELICNQ